MSKQPLIEAMRAVITVQNAMKALRQEATTEDDKGDLASAHEWMAKAEQCCRQAERALLRPDLQEL